MFVHPASDCLPGEPPRVRAPALPFVAAVLRKFVGIVVLTPLAVSASPLFVAGVLVWRWPPHQPRLPEMARYLRHALTVRPREPGIPPLSRAWLLLRVIEKSTRVPLLGLAWYLDEVLYGRALRRTPVEAPLLQLSAARSGSTQLARYLEQDPRLASPAFIHCAAPYLWMWKLFRLALGRVIREEQVRALFDRMLNVEFRARHEGDPFLTDTFEIPYMNSRMHLLSPMLGPEVQAEDLPFMGTAPHNRRVWDEDFVRFLDRVGRKTLLFAGPMPDGAARRLFIKGHFLEARDALSELYPDAHFLTVVRDPLKRLQSSINHIHGNPFADELGAVPWAWFVEPHIEAEVAYCLVEQEWFSAEFGPARTVVRFADYVADLEGTMRSVYRECLGVEELPAHVPTEHAPRERKHYPVNRSLEDAGVDVDALEERLESYAAWCRAPGGQPAGRRD